MMLMAILTSCSQLFVVNNDIINRTDLGEGCDTFRVQQTPNIAKSSGVPMADLMRLNKSITDELTSRGYTKSKRDAEMVVMVNYIVNRTQTADEQGDSVAAESAPRESMVVVSVTRVSDNVPVYHSQLSVNLSKSGGFLQNDEQLVTAANKLFGGFPTNRIKQ